MVAKVVTVAGRNEREAEGVVGGGSATVRGPVNGRGIASITTSGELWERDAEEELVCHCVDTLTL
jgi:hypothetical protein